MKIASETKTQLYAGNICLVTEDSNLPGDFTSKGTKVMLVKLAIGSKTLWICNHNPLVSREDSFCVEAKNLERH